MDTNSQQINPDHLFKSPYAKLILRRLPLRKDELLRAWDAADELLINYCYDNIDFLSNTSNNNEILLINDNFGSLSCALNQFKPDHWGDSITAENSIKYNLKINLLDQIKLTKSTEIPEKKYAFVFLKLPKNDALLEHQLIELIQCISDETLIIAAGMVKYLHKSQFTLFEKIIGNTSTSLAKKKARLLFVTPNKDLLNSQRPSPFPSYYTDEPLGLKLLNHANVFSREKLDIGTRFMLGNFDQLPKASNIIDLGCGNGVLGIVSKRQQQSSFGVNPQIHFVDESYMAIESTRTNYSLAFPNDINTDEVNFIVNDGLNGLNIAAIDLIICNPPFHQNHTIGDHIAWAMFSNSKDQLSKGGVLWVIGNRHMNYHVKLKAIFKNCKTIASNKKFVLLSAINI